MKSARVTSLSLLLLLVPLTAPAADRFDAVREAIRERMMERNIPGFAIAVWKDGEVLWEQGFGWADRENRVPASEHTMFNLASLSKTFTSVGVMTLVQAGRVDLDRPANDYLGVDAIASRIGDARTVTVRSLANHTSGLPGGDQFYYGDEVRDLLSMSETIRRYGIQMAPAGERYRYSNIGYGVLGHLIQQVSGKPYEEYMRQSVFLPLGMTHSSMNLAPGLERHQAVRYDFDRNPLPFYYSAEPASASIYSSAHDLARFGVFFSKHRRSDQKQILSHANIDAMTQQPFIYRPSADASLPGRGYAVGWSTGHAGGHATIDHSGSTSGVSSMLMMVPSQNAGVAVLANVDGGVGDVHLLALKALLPRWRDNKPAAAANAAGKEPVPQAMYGKWQGKLRTFEGEQPIELTVRESGDVHMRIGGEPELSGRSSFLQEALVNDVAYANGELTGRSLAQIQTADTRRLPHTVTFQLSLRDGVLCGSVAANSVFEQRWGYALPHWAELRRVQ